MSRSALLLLCATLLSLCCFTYAGITPHSIAVIVNEGSSASEAVGRYYCYKAGIPSGNLIEVQAWTGENISQEDFTALVSQIRSKFISQLGVDPDDPAHDPIQALVLCYGIPSRISGLTGGLTSETTSVDSYLTLLFNTDPDLGPDSVDGDNR